MSYNVPPPHGPSWNQWAERLNTFLIRNLGKLRSLRGDDKASDDGLLMWSRDYEKPVVSKSGEWKPLAYSYDTYGSFYTDATHSAASSNTAYAITWEGTTYSNGVSVDDTVTSRINFTRPGMYQLDFSCEIVSSNSSSKSIHIWPKVNGVDAPNSTITTSIASNGDRLVVSRSAIFTMAAGDYLEAYFAVSDTGLSIDGTAATAFCPASPSATMIVVEVKA